VKGVENNVNNEIAQSE